MKSILFLASFLIKLVETNMGQQECVATVRNTGTRDLVGRFLYSNGSLALIDDTARFLIYSPAGAVVHDERIVLPYDDFAMNWQHLVAAIFDPSNGIYLLPRTGITYYYVNGILTNPNLLLWQYYSSGQARYNLNLPNNLLHVNYGLEQHLLAVNSSGTLVETQTFNSKNPYGNFYISRMTANPIQMEIFLNSLAHNIYYNGIAPPYDNPTFTIPLAQINSTGKLYSASFPPFILSNTASNAQFIAFSGFTGAASPFGTHTLYLVLRSNPATIASLSLSGGGYYAYSMVIHPTQNKIYFLTTIGDLYVTTFTTTPSVSAPTLLISGCFIKFADLEIFNSTTLIMSTLTSVAVFDLGTETVTLAPIVKPQSSRNMWGTTKMFLTTFNFNLSIFDTSTKLMDNSWTLSGKVREVIVNRFQGTNPRFYVLTDSAITVYSMTTMTALTTLTISGLQTILSPSITTVLRIMDIDILLNNKGVLVASTLCLTATSNIYTVVVWLNEQNLAYQSSNVIATADFVGMSILVIRSAIPAQATNTDVIGVFGVGQCFPFTYVSPSTVTALASAVWNGEGPALANVNWPDITQVYIVSVPYLSKTTATVEVTTSADHAYYGTYNKVITLWTTTTQQFWISPINYNSYQFFKFIPMEKIDGNLTGAQRIYVADQYFGYTNNVTAYTQYMQRDLFPTSIPFQTSDNSVFLTDGYSFVLSISMSKCYHPLQNTNYIDIFNTGNVANCYSSPYFNKNYCGVCNPGYVLSAAMDSCTLCASGFVFYNVCVAVCPIEFISQTAPTANCINATFCSFRYAGYVILGDRCISACPSGTTANSSGYCIPNNASEAALYNSTTALAAICPPGTLYWSHYMQCHALSALPTANYKYNATNIFCDPNTHFYDLQSKRCLLSCSFITGVDPVIGKFCTTAALCRSSLNYYVDPISVPNQCVATCSTNGNYGLLDTLTCTLACPNNYYSFAPNSSCLTAPECMAAGSDPTTLQPYVTLVGTGGNTCTFCPTGSTYDNTTMTCKTNSNSTSNTTGVNSTGGVILDGSDDKLYLFSSGVTNVTVVMAYSAPFLSVMLLESKGLSYVSMMVQSFYKLMMIVNFNFDLGDCYYGQLFYKTFQIFLNRYNNQIGALILGSFTFNLNTNYVCRSGFDRICLSSLKDSFLVNFFLDIFVLLISMVLVLCGILLCKLLKKDGVKEKLMAYLKERMVFSFIIQNDIKCWVLLFLNAFIAIYELGTLVTLKVIGLVCLIVYCYAFLKLEWHDPESVSSTHTRQERIFKYIFEKITFQIKDTIKPGFQNLFTKIYLSHDLLIAITLIPFHYFRVYQIMIWTAIEIAIIVLISIYRIFSTKIRFTSQIVVEILFAALTISMIASTYKTNKDGVAAVIFYIALALVLINTSIYLYALGVSLYASYHSWRFKDSSKSTKTASGEDAKPILISHHSGRLVGSHQGKRPSIMKEGSSSHINRIQPVGSTKDIQNVGSFKRRVSIPVNITHPKKIKLADESSKLTEQAPVTAAVSQIELKPALKPAVSVKPISIQNADHISTSRLFLKHGEQQTSTTSIVGRNENKKQSKLGLGEAAKIIDGSLGSRDQALPLDKLRNGKDANTSMPHK